MDFNTVYAQKLTTADRVAALVKDDDWVDYGWAIGTPVSFDAALAKRLPELHGIKFRGGILCHVPEIFKIENQAEHFCWNSWHMGGIERKAVAAGYAYYSPLRYSELPRYYRELDCPDDVAMFQVAPMDAHGYFNFGPSASHLGAMCERAKHIIVKICHAASAVPSAASTFPMSPTSWKAPTRQSVNWVQAVLLQMWIRLSQS